MHSDEQTPTQALKPEASQLPVPGTTVDMLPAVDDAALEGTAAMAVDTLIISDLHLGAKVSRSKQVLALLRHHSFRRLILNGDVFDDLNFKRLKADDWKLLSFIRKMSHPRTGVDVIWVIGNHDGGVADVLSHLLGVPVYEEYTFEIAGQRHLAIHGHQFDMWVRNRVVITAVATTLYTLLQVVDRKKRVSRWVKRKSKEWLRMGDKIGHAATRHARNHYDAHIVHCGHTHLAVETEINGVRYVNSGSWTDAPSQYVTIGFDGTVTLHHTV